MVVIAWLQLAGVAMNLVTIGMKLESGEFKPWMAGVGLAWSVIPLSLAGRVLGWW